MPLCDLARSCTGYIPGKTGYIHDVVFYIVSMYYLETTFFRWQDIYRRIFWVVLQQIEVYSRLGSPI